MLPSPPPSPSSLPQDFHLSLLKWIAGVQPQSPIRRQTLPTPSPPLLSRSEEEQQKPPNSEPETSNAMAETESGEETQTSAEQVDSSGDPDTSDPQESSSHEMQEKKKTKKMQSDYSTDTSSREDSSPTSGEEFEKRKRIRNPKKLSRVRKKQAKSEMSSSAPTTTTSAETTSGDEQDTSAVSTSKNDNTSEQMGETPTDDDDAQAQESTPATDEEESGWTISEDALLRSMKEDNNGIPWADIGSALNRDKQDVKARWQVIKDQPRETSADEDDAKTTSEDESSASSTSASKKTKKKQNRNGKQRLAQSKNKGKQKENSTVVDDELQKEKRKDRVSTVSKKTRPASSPMSDEDVILSGEEASDESSEASSTDEEPLGYHDERTRNLRRSDLYLYKQVWPHLYPAKIHPQPNGYFSQEDCNVLATFDSKYKRSRWLEMQANFFNVTGRMVPVDALRKQCEAAERRERVERKGAKIAEKQGMIERLRRVEKWVSHLEPDDYHGSTQS